MQIVSIADNLHEMSNTVLFEKNKKNIIMRHLFFLHEMPNLF